MPEPSVGEQELALLRHIADCGGATVGEVADSFGAERQLARSTVLTMMERLRRKGHLARRLAGGVYRYRARRSSAELLRNAVHRFVERNLGGSVMPFLAYLSDATQLTEAELQELKDVVARLESARSTATR
ncbi:MAG: BlaI/MecI/CopY family transcriptional regulator [Candidatus Latescibacterota bacterium]